MLKINGILHTDINITIRRKISIFLFLSTPTFIYPNDFYYVSNITFNGNNSFDTSELMEVSNLKPQKLFSRDKFSTKKLNKDVISLKAFYKSKGFLEININSKYKYLNNKYVSINYNIQEGKQYYLKKIILTGNNLFTNENILSEFSDMIKDKYYNPVLIRKKLQILKQKYLEYGKVDIDIMDEIIIDNNNITVRINIYEGNTYKIRNITITGLKNVKEKYILRELTFLKNDYYNVVDINNSKNRIFNSRLFSSVEIKNIKVENNNSEIDIEIKVREYKASSIEANIGFKQLEPYQSDIDITGIDSKVKWIIGNINNTSSNIEFETRIASEINSKLFSKSPLIERDISITYTNPWTFTLRLPCRFRLFHEEESGDNSITKDGLTYSLWFNKNQDTKYEINSTIEFIDSPLDSINNNEERYIEYKFISNKIDNPINPYGGHYLSINTNLYGTFLGGNINFFRIKSEYRKYINIYNNILALRLMYGHIYTFNKDEILNSRYQFKLGGSTTLRGWSTPDEINSNNGKLITNLINLEYRISLFNNWGTYIFYDIGNLYSNIEDLSNNYIWDYGIGIIYKTKLGPIRFDIGLPYGDINKSQFHASLLYMF